MDGCCLELAHARRWHALAVERCCVASATFWSLARKLIPPLLWALLCCCIRIAGMLPASVVATIGKNERHAVMHRAHLQNCIGRPVGFFLDRRTPPHCHTHTHKSTVLGQRDKSWQEPSPQCQNCSQEIRLWHEFQVVRCHVMAMGQSMSFFSWKWTEHNRTSACHHLSHRHMTMCHWQVCTAVLHPQRLELEFFFNWRFQKIHCDESDKIKVCACSTVSWSSCIEWSDDDSDSKIKSVCLDLKFANDLRSVSFCSCWQFAHLQHHWAFNNLSCHSKDLIVPIDSKSTQAALLRHNDKLH